ncbi:MAG: hypothetical protein OEV00_08325 [Acidobacteriota bacterium]|nr:hypothetical protein [Acidobacteriota bacterium]MDH3785316.1 hypothetical protein [Acidobacteriota bacterium]
MNLTAFCYLAYLIISVAMTIWVAHTLSKNGLLFLVHIFGGDRDLARSVNHLLVVGFYLINLGYISLALKLGYEVLSLTGAIEAVSWKVGCALVVLGGMHFLNLYIFGRLRQGTPLREARRA